MIIADFLMLSRVISNFNDASDNFIPSGIDIDIRNDRVLVTFSIALNDREYETFRMYMDGYRYEITRSTKGTTISFENSSCLTALLTV